MNLPWPIQLITRTPGSIDKFLNTNLIPFFVSVKHLVNCLYLTDNYLNSILFISSEKSYPLQFNN